MRKNWKKTMSLVLAAAMVFSMNTFAFAAKKTSAKIDKYDATYSGNAWSDSKLLTVNVGTVSDQAVGVSQDVVELAIKNAVTVDMDGKDASFSANNLEVTFTGTPFTAGKLSAAQFGYVEFTVSPNKSEVSANTVVSGNQSGKFYVVPEVQTVVETVSATGKGKNANTWSFNIAFDKYVEYNGMNQENGAVVGLKYGTTSFSANVLVTGKNHKKVYLDELTGAKAPLIQLKVSQKTKGWSKEDKKLLADLKKAVAALNKELKKDTTGKYRYYIIPYDITGLKTYTTVPKKKDLKESQVEGFYFKAGKVKHVANDKPQKDKVTGSIKVESIYSKNGVDLGKLLPFKPATKDKNGAWKTKKKDFTWTFNNGSLAVEAVEGSNYRGTATITDVVAK